MGRISATTRQSKRHLKQTRIVSISHWQCVKHGKLAVVKGFLESLQSATVCERTRFGASVNKVRQKHE